MKYKKSPLAPLKQKKFYKIEGVKVSSLCCGLKKNNKEDLVLITFDRKTEIFGAFTKSKTPGEPIIWNKSIMKYGKVSAILINSGNANVFNGNQGKIAVEKILKFLSLKLKIDKKEIFLASTGVIGEPLDYKKIIKKIPRLINQLKNNSSSWKNAANAIITTDTYSKMHSEKINISESEKIHINGIAKGSGMIAPNMATMLSFIFTDANLNLSNFKKIFLDLVEKTFNSITVDSDTSTSDMVLFMFVKGSISKIQNDKNLKQEFLIKSEKLMRELAHLIVKDGEGASKFISIKVGGAKTIKEAKSIGMTVANSPLFKTAMAGSDSNWGRIIMALGKSANDLNPKQISIKFGDYYILENGEVLLKNRNKIDKYLKKNEIDIFIKVGKGTKESTVWTCDLTKEYIRINSDYRS